MLTIPSAILVMASSPYSKSGALWRTYQRHYGRDNPSTLVWKAPTQVMNPAADPKEIARAYEDDPQAAQAEYGAEFREDLIGFISLEALQGVTVDGRYELPPRDGIQYCGFVDPSGGVNDSMTMAVGHREGNVAILDAVIEIRPPFSPDDAVLRCVELARAYRLTRLVADRYAAEWPVARFGEHGIALDQSARPRSELYLNFLALANSGRVELLDHGRLQSQFAGLQRRPGRQGKDSVDHARDSHDDLANSVAGVLVEMDLDRRPSLVDQSRLVTPAGAGHPMPATREGPLTVTFVAAPDGKAAVVYAMMRAPGKILILDFDVGFLAGDFVEKAGARAVELQTLIRPSVTYETMRGAAIWQGLQVKPDQPFLFVNGMGRAAPALNFAGLLPRDFPVTPEELAAFVPMFANTGAIGLSALAIEKSKTLAIGGALDIRPGVDLKDDPLRSAAILAVAVTLPNARFVRDRRRTG